VNARTKSFFQLVTSNKVNEVLTLLEDYPSLAQVIDDCGNGPLSYATSVAMVNALACHGADPSQARGMHPDDAARQRGQIEVADTIRRLWPESAGRG
jgi:hypothetical protein